MRQLEKGSELRNHNVIKKIRGLVKYPRSYVNVFDFYCPLCEYSDSRLVGQVCACLVPYIKLCLHRLFLMR